MAQESRRSASYATGSSQFIASGLERLGKTAFSLRRLLQHDCRVRGSGPSVSRKIRWAVRPASCAEDEDRVRLVVTFGMEWTVFSSLTSLGKTPTPSGKPRLLVAGHRKFAQPLGADQLENQTAQMLHQPITTLFRVTELQNSLSLFGLTQQEGR